MGSSVMGLVMVPRSHVAVRAVLITNVSAVPFSLCYDFFCSVTYVCATKDFALNTNFCFQEILFDWLCLVHLLFLFVSTVDAQMLAVCLSPL